MAEFNHLAFSVILVYRVPGSNQVLRLKRYNGKNYDHTNPIEGETFYDFHVHTATERYQRTGNLIRFVFSPAGFRGILPVAGVWDRTRPRRPFIGR